MAMESPAKFPVTRWSMVTRASRDGAAARAALAWLCERYWEPLRNHAVRRGWKTASADDLVQELFCELIERGDFATVDPTRGRFRTWLLTCLDHRAAREIERRNARKRGGDIDHSEVNDTELFAQSVDLSEAFDRDWAMNLLARGLDRLATAESEAGRIAAFTALRPWLSRNADSGDYAKVGIDLGLNEGAVKVAVHRLRMRFREALQSELAETLAEPSAQAIADELAALQAALAKSGTESW